MAAVATEAAVESSAERCAWKLRGPQLVPVRRAKPPRADVFAVRLSVRWSRKFARLLSLCRRDHRLPLSARIVAARCPHITVPIGGHPLADARLHQAPDTRHCGYRRYRPAPLILHAHRELAMA